MILTDGVHLISDTSEDELHAFAQKMGLKRRWFQNKPDHPHYDLTTKRAQERAIAAGAKLVTGKDIVFALWARFHPEMLEKYQKP